MLFGGSASSTFVRQRLTIEIGAKSTNSSTIVKIKKVFWFDRLTIAIGAKSNHCLIVVKTKQNVCNQLK